MTWQSPDLTPDQLEEVQQIYARLAEIFPDPVVITEEDLHKGLTEDQAWAVHMAARRMLLLQLLSQEYHRHVMDDCGDYLAAATDGWTAVFTDAWTDDFQFYPAHIKTYLTDRDRYPEGGCDGEVRLSIVPHLDPYQED
jgi:hypothetical protein